MTKQCHVDTSLHLLLRLKLPAGDIKRLAFTYDPPGSARDPESYSDCAVEHASQAPSVGGTTRGPAESEVCVHLAARQCNRAVDKRRSLFLVEKCGDESTADYQRRLFSRHPSSQAALAGFTIYSIECLVVNCVGDLGYYIRTLLKRDAHTHTTCMHTHTCHACLRASQEEETSFPRCVLFSRI